jgi:hypothetical protein
MQNAPIWIQVTFVMVIVALHFYPAARVMSNMDKVYRKPTEKEKKLPLFFLWKLEQVVLSIGRTLQERIALSCIVSLVTFSITNAVFNNR